MLVTVLQIITALFSVYGLYCLILGLTQIFITKKHVKTAIAMFGESEIVDPFTLPANRLFGGIGEVVIILDSKTDSEKLEAIIKKYPDVDIYLAEKAQR